MRRRSDAPARSPAIVVGQTAANASADHHQSGTYPVTQVANDPAALQPEQRTDVWDQCSGAYDAFAESVTRPFAEDALRLVRLERGARLLDVASGTGVLARAAARRGARVTATDFAAGMLERLELKCRTEGLDGVAAHVMDGQALTFPEGSFDVAGSLFGLTFFPSPARGLRQLLRVLRPGGRALIATWASPARVDMLRVLGDALLACGHDAPPGPEPGWPALGQGDNLRRLVLDAGFAHAYAIPVRHLATFPSAEHAARLLPGAIPSSAALVQTMRERERAAFFQAIVDGLCSRQGADGPFALSNEALIAVATKSA